MKNATEFQISRLRHALTGDLSVSYSILADLGEMERTPNGFKAIDPEAVQRRIRRAIDRLQSEMPLPNSLTMANRNQVTSA